MAIFPEMYDDLSRDGSRPWIRSGSKKMKIKRLNSKKMKGVTGKCSRVSSV